MAERTEIPFTFTAGTPTKIELVGHDGQTYELRVALAVLAVIDQGVKQPSPYGEIPRFDIQVQLAIDSRPKTNA